MRACSRTIGVYAARAAKSTHLRMILFGKRGILISLTWPKENKMWFNGGSGRSASSVEPGLTAPRHEWTGLVPTEGRLTGLDLRLAR